MHIRHSHSHSPGTGRGRGRGRGPSRHIAACVLPLVVSLATACGTEVDEAKHDSAATPSAERPSADQEAPAAPESPADFLDLADKAMTEQGAWTFAVTGRESLTLQAQKSGATYRATLRRAMEPEAVHSEGVSTSSKGTKKAEEIYVVGGTAYVKEGKAAWKHAPASDAEMRNKIEDPVSALAGFRAYAKADGEAVTVSRTDDGTVELRVTAPREQKLAEVRNQAWVKRAIREFDPTAEQLREAGVPVHEEELTLSRLEEILTLDATTYHITSHRFEFGLLIPYAGGEPIAYEHRVEEKNRGGYEGKIELPDGVA